LGSAPRAQDGRGAALSRPPALSYGAGVPRAGRPPGLDAVTRLPRLILGACVDPKLLNRSNRWGL